MSQSDSHLHGYTLTLARGNPLTPCIPPEKEKIFSFSAGENKYITKALISQGFDTKIKIKTLKS